MFFSHNGDAMNPLEIKAVFGTDELLVSLCESVTKVLALASDSPIRYSAMVQRISKTCLKPDIGCFVLLDGGFSGLAILNFSAQAAMELYERYMLHMGIPKDSLARSFTSDEVANAMGELMNQIIGDFTGKIGRELQTHITQSQPKMLALNKQVVLSVDANLDQPEARRVSFYTGSNNIFYLELAIDGTEFVKIYDFQPHEVPDPDELIAQASDARKRSAPTSTPIPDDGNDNDELLKSLGM